MLDFTSPTEPGVFSFDSSPAAPRVGRSLGGQVAAINQPIRKAVSHLSAMSAPFDLEELLNQSTLSPRDLGGIAEPYAIRSAWLIVSAALLHARSNHASVIFSLESSVAWFMGDVQLAGRIKTHYGARWEYAENALRDAKLGPAFWSLLPYVLEPDGHVTRSEFETCALSRERKARKTKEESEKDFAWGRAGLFSKPGQATRRSLKDSRTLFSPISEPRVSEAQESAVDPVDGERVGRFLGRLMPPSRGGRSDIAPHPSLDPFLWTWECSWPRATHVQHTTKHATATVGPIAWRRQQHIGHWPLAATQI